MTDEVEEWTKFRRYTIEKQICDVDRDYSQEQEPTWCFVFGADCGGDVIFLCEKHLAEALERLRSKLKEDE